MVERLLKVFNKEWSGLHEAAFLLAFTALLSQALGLVRDRLLAHLYGAGESLDVYYAAFRIPDLLYTSIASFVAVTVLIPFLLELTNDKKNVSHERLALRKFIDSIFTVFVVLMVLVCGIIYFFIPHFGHFLVPGFSQHAFDQYVMLSRILLLSPLLLGISNLMGSVTQSLRRFFVFAAGPILYNIGIIVGIVFFLPNFGFEGIAWGVILGALLHVLIQLPVLIHEKLTPRFTFRIDWRAIYRIVTLSIPRTFALSISQLMIIVLVLISSTIETGAIAVFTLAMNLQSIPLSIVGMSYSVAAFPTLARLWSGGEKDQFLRNIVVATRHILFWSFPAIILFIVLRAQIVRSILGTGAFDWTATRLTAAALALFALSVVAQNLVLLFTRTFYAMGRTKLPLYANSFGAISVAVFALFFLYLFDINSTFRYFFETLLRVNDISGTKILMLPLGYSIGMIFNVLLLLLFLKQEFKTFISEIKKSFLHSFSASIALGFFSYHSLQIFAPIFNLNTFWGIFLQGLLSGLVGIFASIFLLRLLNNRELDEVRSSLHQKFWVKKPIITEPEKHGFPSWMLNRRRDYITGEDMHIITNDLKFIKENDLKRLKKIKS